MNITIRVIDVHTYHVSIHEHIDELKATDKPSIVRTGNCLEITGKHDNNGNKFKICMHTSALAGFVVEETEQYGTISLLLYHMSVVIKYAYYKVTGDLCKVINHKFKEDREMLENILEGNVG
jgi:hypothetical protein